MANIGDFAKYEVKLPSRTFLKSLIALGWFMIVAGGAMLVWSFIKFIEDHFDHSSDQRDARPHYCDYYEDYGGDINYIPQECQPESVPVSLAEWIYGHWYYGLILLVIGIVVAAYFYGRFAEYYREVRQGQILALDTSGGGGRGDPLSWEILIKGYTYSNELRRQWREVNAGYWRNAKVGDWLDQR